jgi:hypothetical protein
MKSGPDVFADALVRVAGLLAGVFISHNLESEASRPMRRAAAVT